MELLADHAASRVELVRRHVGDLQQHGRHQVDAFQQLQVDVHVERNLPAFFHFFLLGIPFLETPEKQPLAQELLGATGRLDVQQRVVGVFDQTLAEGADSQLDHGAVVEDLGGVRAGSGRGWGGARAGPGGV